MKGKNENMSFNKFFRKPSERKQGLKILIYGSDGCGKSLITLGFPNVVYIDSEAKGFVYESNPKYNKNLVAVMDTNNYNEAIEALKYILAEKDLGGIKTLVIDSETNIYETMKVVMMELEEERAKKKAIKHGNNVEFAVNDANVSQRAYGKIKNKHNSLKSLKLQLSAMGISVISIAHMKDQLDNNQNKIGEIPDLRKDAKYDYDIVIKCAKEKDIMTQKYKFIAYIEKDTTETFQINEKVDFTWDEGEFGNIIYDKLQPYMEKNGLIINNYKSVETLLEDNINEDDDFKAMNLEYKINEFKDLFSKLNKDGKEKAKSILKEIANTTKIGEIIDVEVFDKVLEEIKKL